MGVFFQVAPRSRPNLAPNLQPAPDRSASGCARIGCNFGQQNLLSYEKKMDNLNSIQSPPLNGIKSLVEIKPPPRLTSRKPQANPIPYSGGTELGNKSVGAELHTANKNSMSKNHFFHYVFHIFKIRSCY